MLSEKRDQYLNEHSELRERVLLQSPKDLAQVHRHLRFGFGVRLEIIEHAMLEFYEHLSNEGTPLPRHRVFYFTWVLNGYYLHLCGALDNLAWALIYKHDLVENPDEGKRKHQVFAALTRNAFLEALTKQGQPELAEHIERFAEWHQDLFTRRHPGVHRIPLYIPPAIVSEDGADEIHRLGEEAARAIREGDRERGWRLMHEQGQVGRYKPLFVTQEPELKFYSLNEQVTTDHDQWLELVAPVVKSLCPKTAA